MTIHTFLYFSDDVMCPVRSFFIYKEHLNPKSDTFFQRPKVRPKNNVWYDVSQLGHNSLGKMVPDICEKAGILRKYTNHSLRATAVHILDEAEFAGRHIMSITGHKSESSLKTYTGYTSDRALRDMSNTISSNLRETENKENDLNSEIPEFDDNFTDFLMMSDSQIESLVTMGTDINNTNSTTCSNGDVNNNVAHAHNSGHGFDMGVPNFNFSMQSNCLQSYSHPAAPLIANNYGTININISHN